MEYFLYIILIYYIIICYPTLFILEGVCPSARVVVYPLEGGWGFSERECSLPLGGVVPSVREGGALPSQRGQASSHTGRQHLP